MAATRNLADYLLDRAIVPDAHTTDQLPEEYQLLGSSDLDEALTQAVALATDRNNNTPGHTERLAWFWYLCTAQRWDATTAGWHLGTLASISTAGRAPIANLLRHLGPAGVKSYLTAVDELTTHPDTHVDLADRTHHQWRDQPELAYEPVLDVTVDLEQLLNNTERRTADRLAFTALALTYETQPGQHARITARIDAATRHLGTYNRADLAEAAQTSRCVRGALYSDNDAAVLSSWCPGIEPFLTPANPALTNRYTQHHHLPIVCWALANGADGEARQQAARTHGPELLVTAGAEHATLTDLNQLEHPAKQTRTMTWLNNRGLTDMIDTWGQSLQPATAEELTRALNYLLRIEETHGPGLLHSTAWTWGTHPNINQHLTPEQRTRLGAATTGDAFANHRLGSIRNPTYTYTQATLEFLLDVPNVIGGHHLEPNTLRGYTVLLAEAIREAIRQHATGLDPALVATALTRWNGTLRETLDTIREL